MARGLARTAGIQWRYSVLAVGGAFVLFLPLVLTDPDFGDLTFLALALSISLGLLATTAIASRRTRVSLLSALVAFVATSSLLFHYNTLDRTTDVRSTIRWLARSHFYKRTLLAQPAPTDGSLRHIEWQGTGFGGNDTVWYLVYDPTDAMAPEVRRRDSGKFTGIPCQVHRARQLEPHWYWVGYYTNTAWNDCGAS